MGYSSGQNLTTSSENIYIGDTAGTLDNLGASPGDEAGVIRIGSVFSGTAACFINGIATNSQVWNGTMLNDKVEKLQATVAQLTQQLKEQAAQIQKVSAQLEASKPALQVVKNP